MADVLVLRTCRQDMSAYGGFKWPTEGPVEAPDWIANDQCGNGLHGALWGEGDGGIFNWDPDAKWLVVSADEKTIVDLKGKVKFPRGTVVYCGDQRGATEYLKAHGGAGRAIIGATAVAGHYGTATAGDGGTATAGYRGTAAAGDHGTATVGKYGTAVAGYCSKATAGDYGKATAGACGKATAGNQGKATAGACGTATAGDHGTATASEYGTATAGHSGELRLRWWDGKRLRTQVAYVGENGILPNVPYTLNSRGEFVRVEV